MTALNTSLNTLDRYGITGNKEFIQECRKAGLKYGVKCDEGGGAGMIFRRGGAGTPGSGDTVPPMGFTRLTESVITGVLAPRDGFRAEALLNRLWVVLAGEDVIKLSKKGVTITSAMESPLTVDNYDDEDAQQTSTEVRLVHYNDTPSSQVSFWTSRGVTGGSTALQPADQIGVIRAIGYKGGAPVQDIAGEAEFLANHDFGTYATGRFRIRLRDSSNALQTVFDADADAITSLADVATTIRHRGDYNNIDNHFWKTGYASLPTLIMRRLNGTEASPSNISNNDEVGSLKTQGRVGGSLVDTSDFKTTVTDASTGEAKVQLRVCSAGGSLGDSIVSYPSGAAIPAAKSFFCQTIESNLDISGTPTDLTVKCGAAKTLVLETPVTEDLQFSISQGKIPSSSEPTWDPSFTTNTGCYKFDVGEYTDMGANETPHSWKEGGTLHVHLHVSPDGGNATGGDRFAKFIVYIVSADVGDVFTEVNLPAELTIPDGTADRTHMYLDMGDLDLTGYHIGAQIDVRVKRIAATGGTEFANDVFITQCGMHCLNDTIGSRTESAK